MLTALLLFTFHAQATCEWVEISQQHYLKPARTTRVYPQITFIKNIEKTTQSNRAYVNNSLSKPIWSKGAIHKIPSSEAKRLISSETVTSKPIKFEDKPRSEVSKKSAERVYYNKDNVKRITFTSTEEPLKPLEVFNLSDLEYDEGEFPAIEVDDEEISVEQLEHTKHVTAVIPTEDEENHTSGNLPNTVQSHTKNYDRKSLSTKAPLKKDITVERKTATKQNVSKDKRDGEGNLTLPNNYDTENSNKVVILQQKSFNTSHDSKSEIIKQKEPTNQYSKNNSSDTHSAPQKTKHEINSENPEITKSNKLNRIQIMDSSSEKSSYKLTQNKPRVEKNVLQIDELPKRSKIRSPEEVMLEEILHESDESFEDFNHKTQHIGTIKKVSSKSAIATVNKNIDKSDAKDFQTVESQIQRNKNENIRTVDTIQTKSNEQKDIKKESVTTATTSSTKEQSNEFEHVLTPLPVETENLFEHSELNNRREDRFEIVNTSEKYHSEETENHNLFVLTATSNQGKTKINTEPFSAETIATTAKVEFTTKPSLPDKIMTASLVNVETVKLDSEKPPEIKSSDHQTEETVANDTVFDTLGTLVKVLKLVTETISRNTRKSVRGKMQYLEELRDTILASIEQRLEAVFPDDAAPRRARSARAHERGHHVEFPSSESALMTISFLTFAVFLIKLVLQVIQAYKHKAMVMPAVVATVGRAYHQYSKMKAGDKK